MSAGERVSAAELEAEYSPTILAALAADGLNMGRMQAEHRMAAERRARWAQGRLALVAVWGGVGWTAAGVAVAVFA